nr:MAG TPA: hypothetical protein [Bacteriophage sp.]
MAIAYPSPKLNAPNCDLTSFSTSGFVKSPPDCPLIFETATNFIGEFSSVLKGISSVSDISSEV